MKAHIKITVILKFSQELKQQNSNLDSNQQTTMSKENSAIHKLSSKDPFVNIRENARLKQQ